MPSDAFVIQHLKSNALNVGEKTNTANVIRKPVCVAQNRKHKSAVRR